MDTLVEPIRRLPLQAHICSFYESQSQRLDLIAAYYKVGLERRERCIFVTDQEPAQLNEELKKRGLDISGAVKKNDFKIFPINPTYLADGTFYSENMLANLRDFVKQAMQLDYSGVRGGGDMHWVARKVPGLHQVGEYESKINRFIRSSKFTGLCLFPSKLKDEPIIKDIIQTHQHLVHDEELYPNPFYVPPEQFFKSEINLVAQLESWLDRLDEQEVRL